MVQSSTWFVITQVEYHVQDHGFPCISLRSWNVTPASLLWFRLCRRSHCGITGSLPGRSFIRVSWEAMHFGCFLCFFCIYIASFFFTATHFVPCQHEALQLFCFGCCENSWRTSCPVSSLCAAVLRWSGDSRWMQQWYFCSFLCFVRNDHRLHWSWYSISFGATMRCMVTAPVGIFFAALLLCSLHIDRPRLFMPGDNARVLSVRYLALRNS